ncbi:hypothetical protein M2336_002929 [Sphingobium sp. B1D7B]|uniref:DUF6984 family protein n=1 Tax=unclassified Sphingobium TaxID=2611147 RepID=UPI002224D586|nr:hypothetical protein [Sphingobium sp. B11D3A]MCW2406300.1 hypothetical protein [Sphingobium sp. B1D7B]
MHSAPRPLKPEERALVAYLWEVNECSNALPPELLVEEMDDGGMGSLSFVSQKLERTYGGEAGSCGFYDEDGMQVRVGLILDQDGDLYELDLWTVDFSPLIKIPEPCSFFDKRAPA